MSETLQIETFKILDSGKVEKDAKKLIKQKKDDSERNATNARKNNIEDYRELV